MERLTFEEQTNHAKQYLINNYISIAISVANGYDIRATEKELLEFMANYSVHIADIEAKAVKEEMQLRIDKQIERTAESVSYAVANRESEIEEEINTLKQDIRMLCGLIQDFEWPKHLFETISNVVMNAEAHSIS